MFHQLGQSKDTLGQEQSGLVPRMSLTAGDQHMFFISQKSDRITTALYMVTSFIDDKEPFKWEVRHKAIRLLSSVHTFKNHELIFEKETLAEESLGYLSDILSLLKFGLSTGFFSQMNYSILRDEYTALEESLKDRFSKSQPLDGVVLPADVFEIEYKRHSNKGHSLSDTNSQKQEPSKTNVLESDLSDRSLSSESGNIENGEVFEGGESIDNKRRARRELILSILRARNDLGVKDLVELMPGCGEKTIQRELASLAKEGLVKKTGERRWSKYVLATSH